MIWFPARCTASDEPLVDSMRIQTTILPLPFSIGAKNTYQPSLMLSPFQIRSGVPVLPATRIFRIHSFGALCSIMYFLSIVAYCGSFASLIAGFTGWAVSLTFSTKRFATSDPLLATDDTSLATAAGVAISSPCPQAMPEMPLALVLWILFGSYLGLVLNSVLRHR